MQTNNDECYPTIIYIFSGLYDQYCLVTLVLNRDHNGKLRVSQMARILKRLLKVRCLKGEVRFTTVMFSKLGIRNNLIEHLLEGLLFLR